MAASVRRTGDGLIPSYLFAVTLPLGLLTESEAKHLIPIVVNLCAIMSLPGPERAAAISHPTANNNLKRGDCFPGAPGSSPPRNDLRFPHEAQLLKAIGIIHILTYYRALTCHLSHTHNTYHIGRQYVSYCSDRGNG